MHANTNGFTELCQEKENNKFLTNYRQIVNIAVHMVPIAPNCTNMVDDKKVKVRTQQFVIEITHPYGKSHAIRDHSVTCHPAEVTFPPLSQPKLVLDLSTPERCHSGGYIPR